MTIRLYISQKTYIVVSLSKFKKDSMNLLLSKVILVLHFHYHSTSYKDLNILSNRQVLTMLSNYLVFDITTVYFTIIYGGDGIHNTQ